MSSEIDPATAEAFCKALDSIDDVVADINKDGPVEVEIPADLGTILSRLGKKFDEVSKDAPTSKMEADTAPAAITFNQAAETLLADPPIVGIDRAQEIFAGAMGVIEEGGAEVRAFRVEYCPNGDH